jgi:hypothetical protein
MLRMNLFAFKRAGGRRRCGRLAVNTRRANGSEVGLVGGNDRVCYRSLARLNKPRLLRQRQEVHRGRYGGRADSPDAPASPPIVRSLDELCPRALTAHATAAAPPSSVMNSRRFTGQYLPCFDRKDSTPQPQQETAAPARSIRRLPSLRCRADALGQAAASARARMALGRRDAPHRRGSVRSSPRRSRAR